MPLTSNKTILDNVRKNVQEQIDANAAAAAAAAAGAAAYEEFLSDALLPHTVTFGGLGAQTPEFYASSATGHLPIVSDQVPTTSVSWPMPAGPWVDVDTVGEVFSFNKPGVYTLQIPEPYFTMPGDQTPRLGGRLVFACRAENPTPASSGRLVESNSNATLPSLSVTPLR